MTPRFVVGFGTLCALLALASPAAGQDDAPRGVAPDGRLEGRVLRHGEPAAGIRVVLHRVAAEMAGGVDSVRTDAAGRFAFRLPGAAEPVFDEVVYFASVFHQGVLYFGPPLTRNTLPDSVYTIQVFDTTVAPAGGVALPVAMRHLILEREAGGWRVTDLVQVSHTGARTYVAAEGAGTWVYPLPRGAADFEAGEGDVAPDALRLEDGMVRVSSPIPPGERLYLFRYRVPAPSFELPLPGNTGRLELLVREPAPPLNLAGLTPGQSVSLDGNTYRRWGGGPFRDAMIRIEEAKSAGPPPLFWIGVALAVALAGAVTYALRRGRAGAPAGRARASLLLELARLDEEFAERTDLDEESRRRYRQRRAALKERLRALDARGSARAGR